MTPLARKITRRSSETYRGRSKLRRIVVTLYPSGIIGLRLERTRIEETLPLYMAYETAVRARVAFERAQKAKRKGGRS
jgi:aminoglycoside phosphotransferase family enzyme